MERYRDSGACDASVSRQVHNSFSMVSYVQ